MFYLGDSVKHRTFPGTPDLGSQGSGVPGTPDMGSMGLPIKPTTGISLYPTSPSGASGIQGSGEQGNSESLAV